MIAVITISVYFLFNPVTQGAFFPKCTVKTLTGLSCPSCGNQRALHALLHGHISQAFAYNYFLLFAGPFFLLLILSVIFRSSHPKPYRLMISRKSALIYITTYIAWFITRNLLNI